MRRISAYSLVLFIGVVPLGMIRVILIVDCELLGCFGSVVRRALWRLILARMLVAGIIVVIFGAGSAVRHWKLGANGCEPFHAGKAALAEVCAGSGHISISAF